MSQTSVWMPRDMLRCCFGSTNAFFETFFHWHVNKVTIFWKILVVEGPFGSQSPKKQFHPFFLFFECWWKKIQPSGWDDERKLSISCDVSRKHSPKLTVRTWKDNIPKGKLIETNPRVSGASLFVAGTLARLIGVPQISEASTYLIFLRAWPPHLWNRFEAQQISLQCQPATRAAWLLYHHPWSQAIRRKWKGNTTTKGFHKTTTTKSDTKHWRCFPFSPHFFWEKNRYDSEDPTREKRFKVFFFLPEFGLEGCASLFNFWSSKNKELHLFHLDYLRMGHK